MKILSGAERLLNVRKVESPLHSSTMFLHSDEKGRLKRTRQRSRQEGRIPRNKMQHRSASNTCHDTVKMKAVGKKKRVGFLDQLNFPGFWSRRDELWIVMQVVAGLT
jgi:hypothetical protein